MKQKDILFLSVSIFVLILAWIIFSVVHNFMASTISEPLEKKISPISSDFDTQTIENLKKKEKIEPFYGEEVNSSPSAIVENELPENATSSGSSLEVNQ